MPPFFIYLIQVNIALALFFLLYAIVLKKDTFFRFRRMFFLSAIVFSLLYPFFAIPALNDILVFHSSDLQENNITVLVGEPGLAMEVMGEDAVDVSQVPVSWEINFYLLYAFVTLVFIFRFVSQCVSIYRIWTKSERQLVSGVPVYQLKEDITPFSFFNLIFIHTGKHSEAELSQIILHEQTHVSQCHSIDITLFELLCLFSWWNPFVWLMRREINMNLEYLADHGVLSEGVDCRTYQYHLLRLTYHESDIRIVNNFNVSQIKQRIMMMNKAKSSSLTVAKYFLIVPLFFILMAANSIYAAQNEDNTVTIQSAGENSHVLAQPAMGQGDLNTVLSGAPDETNGNEIISVRDDQPQYPGGEQALMRYMADNIRYPVIAQENGIQGRVVCTFAITKDGSIDNVGVLHGVDPSLDAEAMRIIKMMPKWEPATKQGKTVDTHAMISVVFRLQGDGPDDLLTKEEREALFEKNKPSRAEIKDGTLLIDEVVVVGYGAKKSTVQQILDRDKENSADGDEVFVVVEVQPQFPGGIDALNKFIKENLRYPEEAREQAIQGRVICAFIVAKDGSLEDVEVVRSLATSLDAEALRVIKSMPAWKPGTQRGNTVRVRYVLPVTFGFEDKNDTGKVS